MTSDPFVAARAATQRAGLGPLPQAIRQWRDSAVGWIRVSDPAAAGLLAAPKPARGRPRLVVVGETNRGKSSLVNSLIGAPGLSPVDAGVATCTYLLFQYADQSTAVAHFGGGMADISFPAAQLAAFATVDGEPDDDIPPPRWIEVGVPAPLLQSISVVDTPGVGGLVAAHAELAAEAAAAATALLFVVDASAPFTRGELDFLRQVGDRVDTVHFAVTKTDAFRGWRDIVQADRELLARYAPRFSDALFHPVSNRLVDAAATQADPRMAELLLAQSGITELRNTVIDDVAFRAEVLRDANAIRTTIAVLAGECEKLAAARRALTAGIEQGNQLRSRRDALLGQRKVGGRSWQVMLRAEIQRARVDLTHEVAREVREASQGFRSAIDRADNDELKKVPFHIDAYVQAMTGRAHGRLLEAMRRIVHTVLAQLFTPQELTVLAGALATRPYESLTTRAPERAKSADDNIMSLMGAGMGFSLSGVLQSAGSLVLPAALGVALLPVGFVVGGATAWLVVRSRRRVQDRTHLKQWLTEVLGETKAQIDQNIAEQFIEADEQLTLALDDVLTRQVAALDAEIKQVEGALKLDAAERTGRIKATEARRTAAADLMAVGETLLRRIRNARPADEPGDGVPGSGARDAGAPTGPVPLVPAVSNPAVSDPAGSNPAVSNPAASNPAVSNPAVSNPARVSPEVSGSARGESDRGLTEPTGPTVALPVPTRQPAGPDRRGPEVTGPVIPTAGALGAMLRPAQARPPAPFPAAVRKPAPAAESEQTQQQRPLWSPPPAD